MVSSTPLIECVINISEGRDARLISILQERISRLEAHLLHLDIGWDAHRTVLTFAGTPDQVFETARFIYQFAEANFDMRKQQGEHPRIGAVDVCPFIPLRGISQEELKPQVNAFARSIADHFSIPVYLYQESALRPERYALSNIRKPQFEGLAQRLREPKWKPDFGPDAMHPSLGATVIGVRKLMIAYNISLNSLDLRLAHNIAASIRTTGKKVRYNNGKVRRIPGHFQYVQAIGWLMPKYGCVQISMNLHRFKITGIWEVYEKIQELAKSQGVAVAGSELIGLMPEEALWPNPKNLKMYEAIEYLQLNWREPFDPESRILDWVLRNHGLLSAGEHVDHRL